MNGTNPCPWHADHESRIKRLETHDEEVQKIMRSHSIIIAIIGLVGTVFTGTAAFLGVVLAPLVKGWLGL